MTTSRIDVVKTVAVWNGKSYDHEPTANLPGWNMSGGDRRSFDSLRGAMQSLRHQLRVDAAGFKPGARFFVYAIAYQDGPANGKVDAGMLCHE